MWRRKRFIKSRRTYKDSTPDENLQAGRAGASGEKADLFDVKEGVPLVPGDLHDLARHINCRAIDREEDFIAFDYHLCRLSHARSLIDLCLGELLSAFRKAEGKAYGEMGYSKLDDFADEHLSFSGRLASEMILNFERLQALPLTREAYIKGDIVKSALRLLLRVMTRENEAELLAEIRELSVREIDELVKRKLRTARMCSGKKNMTGGESEGDMTGKADTADNLVSGDSAADTPGGAAVVIPEDGSEVVLPVAATGDVAESGLSQEEQISEEQISEEQVSEGQASEEIPSEEDDREEGSGVVMKFNVPRTLALTWDFALEHYRENEKTKGPLYGFVEALIASFLDSTADLAVSEGPASSGGKEQAAESASGIIPEFCAGAMDESGPASVGGREVPLLYTDAIWDCFTAEREMRTCNRDDSPVSAETGAGRSTEAGAGRAADAGGGKEEDSADEYPDPQNEEWLRQIREELALQPFVVKLPEEYSQIPSDSYALSQKIIRVASMRQSIDYHIGWFLKAIRDRYLYRIMEFSKMEDYAKARINISASTTFRLIRLVSYFSNHPVIEKAFLKRRITREQAYLIASLQEGRHEGIWLDFAMSRPTKELRDEVNRILRIKEFDYFASHNYALLPGFRYITDDRYDGLSDEMKDILRTGAWYKAPGSEWPLSENDEHFLDRDFADEIAEDSDAAQLSKCAPDPGENSARADSSRLSKCAADVETGACQCREGDYHHTGEALKQAKALCTLPDKHRPAMTLLLDVLESMDGQDGGDASSPSSDSGDSARSSGSAEPGVLSAADISDNSVVSGSRSYHREPAMSIRFFLPRGLYGVWNDAVRRYVSLISPDDGVELLVNNEGVGNFIALLLTEYLLTEKAHHKAAHNDRVLERDGYKCQVPGCSNRRNIHAHHLTFRSKGCSDAIHNLLSLCASHHLWILHMLQGLKILGTAPDDLTFTFDPGASPEGYPFMIYSNGRKVLPAPRILIDT
ncbi:MAG: HNH endonuclease [Vulcanimicrobiota bacterium]